MSSNVLDEIIANKKIEVAARLEQTPLTSFIERVGPSKRSLLEALSHDYADFILECKKASPSKGLIRKDFDLKEILHQYKDFASAISVLTDQAYFQGDLNYLKLASEQVELPVLCKDFFVDAYQVYEARFFGADAVLLMLSVLDDSSYNQLASVAASLRMDVLTEVHDEEELERAISLNAKIIGINNRNLKDLSIDLSTTERLAAKIPADRLVISESGINSRQDITRLAPLVNGFLIGSSIMAQDNIRAHCKSLLFGNIKICGLTKAEDALLVDEHGGRYGGLIFYPPSPRYVDQVTAREIITAAPLDFVGVFVNQSLEKMSAIAASLNLFAIQLHGDESDELINQLRLQLDQNGLKNIEIWRAFPVKNEVNIIQNKNIDRYLLDNFDSNKRGGSGTVFDWELLDDLNVSQTIVAGGVNPVNINQALSHNTFGVDLSSGVESKPGEKSPTKIAQLFRKSRVEGKSNPQNKTGLTL